MDISFDDNILAVGYDNCRLETIDLQKLIHDVDEISEGMTDGSKYILDNYKTKQSMVLCCKFTYENLLLAVSVLCGDYK